jgi:membrane associated rhomboid family serine protease
MGRITPTVKHLIIINALFFAGKLAMPDVFDRLFSIYYFENPNFQVWQPITSMFMHADFGHILFNMFGLYMFGSPLEGLWGRKKFLFFYFSAGLGAALIHTTVGYYQFHSGLDTLLAAGIPENEIWDMLETAVKEGQYYNQPILGSQSDSFFRSFLVPALGASGAIMGILVAFGLLYPNMELMLIFLPIPIKAKYFIPILVLIDLFSGLTGFSLFGQGIAHWAHLGGALFGFIMAYYWKKNSFNNKRWD